jgi:antirestriction protein ArdC
MNTNKKSNDVYQIVTDRIIELLESDNVPWKKPWNNGLPKNLITKKTYRGINILLLSSLHYPQNYFLTFTQVKSLGGAVKAGEKSQIVVYWNRPDESDVDSSDEKKLRKPWLRYYHVFNVSQCTGIPSELIPAYNKENYPIHACDCIIEHMPNKPTIRYDENDAYYHPALDYINMPEMEYFIASEAFYATFFHELVHSTGHKKRLNRKELLNPTRFGTDQYSTEELVAEIGACYLQTIAGIFHNNVANSGAYIEGWLGKLRNDKRCIIYASRLAQKAVDYIINAEVNTIEDSEHSAQLQTASA